MSTRGRPKDDAARERIITEAADLFVRNGYGGTTMGAIAEKAGVAVKTLYSAYGGKVGILEAVHFKAVRGSFGPVRLIDQDWVETLSEVESVQAGWEQVSRRQIMSAHRVAPIMGVMSDSACEPEVSALLEELKASRHEFWSGIAEILAKLPGANPSLHIDTLADVMNNLRSAESYLMFVNERGWEEAKWQQWTDGVILRELTGK